MATRTENEGADVRHTISAINRNLIAYNEWTGEVVRERRTKGGGLFGWFDRWDREDPPLGATCTIMNNGQAQGVPMTASTGSLKFTSVAVGTNAASSGPGTWAGNIRSMRIDYTFNGSPQFVQEGPDYLGPVLAVAVILFAVVVVVALIVLFW